MLESGNEDKLETNKIGEKYYKKAQTRNINKYKKLFLIWECCKYRNKYYALNKTKCWVIISDILKQQTGYHLVNS